MATREALPAIGAHFRGGEGKFTWVMEYVGPNPAPQYESQDAHIVRVVETCTGGPPLGTESAVETKWFETHKALDLVAELRAALRKQGKERG